MSALTKRQRTALDAIIAAGRITPDELAAQLGTSPEGAAATASSLVKRRLINRTRTGGRVAYETPATTEARR